MACLQVVEHPCAPRPIATKPMAALSLRYVRRSIARFPPLDAGPRAGVLGHSHARRAPFCRCAAGQGGARPTACITSPSVLVMQARFAYPAPGCAGRAGLATLRPPCPAALRRGGAMPPNSLGSVGAATGLAAPYGHRLPRPALSRWGGSCGRGCASPDACPAAARRPPKPLSVMPMSLKYQRCEAQSCSPCSGP